MSEAGRRDTAPEMAVRRELHSRGFRYLVDVPLPTMPRRRADLIFRRERVAVFIDGCFWHSCPTHGVSPRSNSGWWKRKLEANRARDADTVSRLEDLGWLAVRCWEHEPAPQAADRIESVLRKRREATTGE
jgi:DNA mismatch endonuclease (patch repair protein)